MMDLIEKLNLIQQKGRAILAFNVQNINHIYILSEVANNLKAPVIAQLSQKYISYFDNLIGLRHLVKRFQNQFLTFHLDHCMDINIIHKCIDCGFASVMYDGSSLPIEENIRNTIDVYNLAHREGSLLEVELGSIGGIEDGLGTGREDLFSDKELVEFAESAKFDLLALAIGNAHGNYRSTSGIKIELLDHASKLIGKRMYVLHGATGMPLDMIKKAIKSGVVKVNVSTALKTITFEALKNYTGGMQEYNEDIFFSMLAERLNVFFKDYITKYTI